jgi:hypothetical protein
VAQVAVVHIQVAQREPEQPHLFKEISVVLSLLHPAAIIKAVQVVVVLVVLELISQALQMEMELLVEMELLHQYLVHLSLMQVVVAAAVLLLGQVLQMELVVLLELVMMELVVLVVL